MASFPIWEIVHCINQKTSRFDLYLGNIDIGRVLLSTFTLMKVIKTHEYNG